MVGEGALECIGVLTSPFLVMHLDHARGLSCSEGPADQIERAQIERLHSVESYKE